MKKHVIGLLSIVILAGCEDVRDSFKMRRRAPNSLTVAGQEKLQMPETFDLLPPPQPGTPRPQILGASLMVQKLLDAQVKNPERVVFEMSPGQLELLKAFGDRATFAIRREIEQESFQNALTSDTMTDSLRAMLPWKKPLKPGEPVDAIFEAKKYFAYIRYQLPVEVIEEIQPDSVWTAEETAQ